MPGSNDVTGVRDEYGMFWRRKPTRYYRPAEAELVFGSGNGRLGAAITKAIADTAKHNIESPKAYR